MLEHPKHFTGAPNDLLDVIITKMVSNDEEDSGDIILF